MAEDISEAEDTLIYGLTGLNTMGRILLENGKQEAAGTVYDVTTSISVPILLHYLANSHATYAKL